MAYIQKSLSQDCGNAFYSTTSFNANGLKRPAYTATPQVSDDLKYCKMYNGKSSCCNQASDNDIGDYHKVLKEAIKTMAKARQRQIKDTFENFKKVELPGVEKASDIKAKIQTLVEDIKGRAKNTTKQMNLCAKGALRATAGLLCHGCDSNYQESQVDGKQAVNRGDCRSLAAHCMGLIDSQEEEQDASITAVMNITSAIAEYAGEVPDESETEGDPIMDRFDFNETDPTADAFVDKAPDADFDTEFKDFVEFDPNLRLLQFKKPTKNKHGKEVIKPVILIPPKERTADDNQKLTIANDKKVRADIKPQEAAAEVCNIANKKFGTSNIKACKLCYKPTTKGTTESDNATASTQIDNNVAPTSAGCTNHPLKRGASDFDYEDYLQRSSMSVIPANIKVKVTGPDGKTKGLIVPFVFTNSTKNDQLFKYMNHPKIDVKSKQKLVQTTMKEIKRDQDLFKKRKSFDDAEKAAVEGGGGTYTAKNYVTKAQLNKAVGGNGRGTTCAVAQVIKLAGTEKSPMKSDTDCKFKFEYGVTASSNLCGNTTIDQKLSDGLFKAADRCANKTAAFQKIEMDCKDKFCRVCMDDNCFEQSFEVLPVSVKKPFDKKKAKEQFTKDPRMDPVTGRRIPESIDLPNVTNATNKPFERPCSGLEECSTWFCDTFMNGPVVDIKKSISPNNLDDAGQEFDEDLKEVYNGKPPKKKYDVATFDPKDQSKFFAPPPDEKKPTRRILSERILSESKAVISDNGGVGFNQIGDSSGMEHTVAIDGVTESATPVETASTNAIKLLFNASIFLIIVLLY